MNTDNTMNKQQVFDKVVQHLLTQNAKSTNGESTNGGNGCQYLSSEGLKCAVGCLIPSNEYDQRIEGGNIVGLLFGKGMKICPPSLMALKQHQDMLCRLQWIHDSDPVSGWAERLMELAHEYKLQFNPPEQYNAKP